MFQKPFNPARVLFLAAVILAAGYSAVAGLTLESFDEGLPEGLSASGASTKLVRGQDGKALQVTIKKGGRGIRLEPASGVWNWAEFAGLVMDVTNTSRKPEEVFVGVDSRDAGGNLLKGRVSRTFGPKETLPLHLFLTNAGTGPFAGLRAIPIYGVLSVHGAKVPRFRIDPERVLAVEVYLLNPEKTTTLVLDNLRLFKEGSAEERIVPFPWVDRFGQLKHRDFFGKASSVEDLHTQRDEEARALANTPNLPGRDAYGGWADGPQLEATGWFRTENVDGKWWLVTPNGHLFLSFGACYVRHGCGTRTQGFEHWFDELPEQGRFYLTNLRRKYGDNFAEVWREVTYKRFNSWGLNTIANSSQLDVLLASPLPYTAWIAVQNKLSRVEGTEGFWSKLAEFYDPEFEAIVDKTVAGETREHKDNPLCIGYFVDNEMAWDSIRDGVLASPPGQPSRIVFINKLKEKYPDIAALNAAWGSNATDWDSLRAPARPTTKCIADLDELAYMLARRYFDVVNAALEKYAPNQLYLGARFMQTAPRPVMRACADVADVFSVNRYNVRINREEWEGENDVGKPVLISEFHIGAADRFMMHPGLVAAETQEERAEMTKHYLNSTIDCPAFVGCHWFQYMDQPVTGRAGDLESFNTGLVSETDFPYPEMVEALQDVLSKAYPRRAGK